MKYYLLFFNFILLSNLSTAQVGMWTWIKGDTISNDSAVYGVKGVPSPVNTPAGAYNCVGWVDQEGMFWSFGGGNSFGWQNDLWRFNPETLEWTWMKGPGEGNNLGHYGSQGVPDPENIPPARGFGTLTWTGNDGLLWLYGGYANIDGERFYNDLWNYNPTTNTWTWVSGSSTPNQQPVYGIQGVPSEMNTPGARAETGATWVDDSNNLWLFGGASSDVNTPQWHMLNDLWKYNIETNEWTFVKGQSYEDADGNYGTLGVPSPENEPPARMSYATWVDSEGRFYLFGGNDWDSSYLLHNDMWRYNPETNMWTWLKGTSNANDIGYSGNMCLETDAANPSSRFENRANWAINNHFFMFGGYHDSDSSNNQMLNDLWVYSVENNSWTWIAGDSIGNQPAVYGTKGIAAPENKPLGRMGAIAWYDKAGSAYIFGGYEYNHQTPSSAKLMTDVWKYEIDTNCVSYTSISEIEGVYFQLYPNPTSELLNIYLSSPREEVALRIYDMQGRMVYSKSITPSQDNFKINIRKYSEAELFYVILSTADSVIRKKVIVMDY
ncbi:T9SS type A sorting domain-containing protein [Halocola ammonii]